MVVVSIAKGWDTHSTTMEALRNLVEVGVYVPKISVVKPNLLSTVNTVGCINTDSRVCEAVADFLISLGNKEVICAEGTTHGRGDKQLTKTFTAFRNNGYYKMMDKISHYVDFNQNEPVKWIRTLSPGLGYKVDLGIARVAVENSVASVAKFKTHDILGLTLTLKNMMGSLCRARKADTNEILARGWRTKRFMHGWGIKAPSRVLTVEQIVGPAKIALAKNLVILASHNTPSLGVIDGIVAMGGDGPISGTSKKLGVVIASTDVVACDVVACEVAGFDAVETGYIYAAGRIGLGEYRLEEIEVVGEKIENVKQSLNKSRLFPRAKFSKEATERLIKEVKKLL